MCCNAIAANVEKQQRPDAPAIRDLTSVCDSLALAAPMAVRVARGLNHCGGQEVLYRVVMT